jgi:predicted Zn-dependent protease
MTPTEVCDRVLELTARRSAGRGVAVEVTASSGRSAVTRFANSHIHQNVADDHGDVRLRVVADGRLATASTSRLDDEGLGRLVDGALAARLRPPDPGWPGLAPPAAAPALDRHDPATQWAPPERRAEVVADFVAAGEGLAAAGFCESGGHEVAFANSGGQRLVGRASRATVEGVHRTETSDGAGWRSAARLSDVDGAAAGATAAAKARAGTDPVEVEPGRYEVVVEPAAVADVLGFLLGGFSAKAFAEGRSFVRLGEAQLDPAIGIVDDATHPATLGLAFDAEGTPKRRVELVAGGVPVGLLHDRRTALRAGVESTGHAVAGGETWGPIALNPALAAGGRSPDDLVASVPRGLLVTELWYTRILDPKTQAVTGLTRNGTFLVEGGRVTAPVRNLRFTQSYAEALGPGGVLGVGSDLRLLPSGYLVPSLHLASWNFTGGARG